MKIILLGAPGSGKGTVAEQLVKEFKLLHVSAGELLRQEVASGSTVGKEIKKIIDQGNLVPDHLVIELVRLIIKDKDNFILDGFPRTVHQAKDISNLRIGKVIYLEISEQEAVERISGRRVCERGTHTYQLKYLPPKRKGFCDLDQTKLIQRDDDREGIVRERFRVYTEKTKPVIEYYAKLGSLITINAAKSPEKVYRDVRKFLASSANK